MLLNELFVDLIGVPHVTDGRDPKVGLDCYGLVLEASRRIGYFAPDYNDPAFVGGEIDCVGFIDNYKVQIDKLSDKENDLPYVKIEKPEPGCMVLLIYIHPYATHIGIVLDDCDHFIHAASKNKAVCIEKLSSISWRHRIKGFYKWTKRLN